MKELKNKEEVIKDRPESFFRICRSDDFEKFCNFEKYINSGYSEVRYFYMYLIDIVKKRGGQSTKLVAGHLEDVNKGYPNGFTDYSTYDERREKNFLNMIKREEERKKKESI